MTHAGPSIDGGLIAPVACSVGGLAAPDVEARLSPDACEDSPPSTSGAGEADRRVAGSASDALKYGISGGFAGAFSKTCTAPLARLTILYQVQGVTPAGSALSTAAGTAPARAPPPNLVAAFREVVARDGWRALWRGNGVTVLHRLPYSSINFLVYERTSEWLQRRMPRERDVARRLLAGGCAGLVACTAAYPLDLVRTRLAAQTGAAAAGARGIRRTVAAALRREGPAGLYSGLGATLAQVVPSLALNFSIYESAREWATGSERGGAPPSAAASLGCGCAAGLATSTLTFPLDVVRRRMQLQGRRGRAAAGGAGYRQVISDILRTRGLRGFYAGIVPEYCKVTPGVAIAFFTYERMKLWLGVR